MRAQLASCGTFSIPYTVTTPCREGEILESNLNLNVYPNPLVGADIAMWGSSSNIPKNGDYFYVNFACISIGDQ